MIETKNENLNVFSNSFLCILRDINKKIKSPLVDYILNNSKSVFSDNYRQLTLGLNESDLSEYTAEEKESIKDSVFYTPKGKSCFFEDDNLNIVKKKFRQSGNIGSIINKLVEHNSKIVKGEKVLDSLGNEYLYDKKYSIFINEKTKQVTFFENEDWIVQRKNYEYKKTKFADSLYEQLGNELKAELCSSLEFKIVTGNDIVKYYNAETYSSKYGTEGGCLHGSCMRYKKCEVGIKFYAKNPNASMLIMIFNGKIVSRSMIWKTDVGIFMDRKYFSADFLANSMVQYARENHWHYKTCNNYSENYKVTAYNFLKGNYDNVNYFPMNVQIPEEYDGSDRYPYMDTFDKLYPVDGVISNYFRYAKGSGYRIKSTDLNTQYISDGIRLMYSGTSRDDKSGVLKSGLFSFYPESNVCLVKDFEGNDILNTFASNVKDPDKNVNMYDKDAVERFLNKEKSNK